MKKILFTLTLALTCAAGISAQSGKIADKEIVGTWLMESMQWDGEKKIVCGKKAGSIQFKYYGANGEYACAAIVLTKEGQCVVLPHEYGTYSLKNGMYSEMGRPAIKNAVVFLSKDTYKGRWTNRTDIWKKKALPDRLVKYIVERCKLEETPTDIQQLIKQSMFK
ncbi:MAG: hypothetical protein IJ209_09005 [Bacteroidaceae bacterium]|nr:hypothetical protein [Bacteroidaceae bacterium]